MAYATLVSIDAWRHDGSWTWNNSFKLREYSAEEIAKVLDGDNPRKIFAFLRAEGYLSAKSAGKVRLDVAGSDPEYLTIEHRHTGEPIFAFIVEYNDGIAEGREPAENPATAPLTPFFVRAK